MNRRQLLLGALGMGLYHQASALQNLTALYSPQLNTEQSLRFRDWLVFIVRSQLINGPTPRWLQRDCAGLIRFSVAEALRSHDEKWQRSMSLYGKKLPAELQLNEEEKQWRHSWQTIDGKKSNWVSALGLIQENTRFIGRDPVQAQSGDLFFYDQGNDQHLMIWMGRYLAYHTGHSTEKDSGLRAYYLSQMMAWRDSRWKPHTDNPNFAGVYRLNFVV